MIGCKPELVTREFPVPKRYLFLLVLSKGLSWLLRSEEQNLLHIEV